MVTTGSRVPCSRSPTTEYAESTEGTIASFHLHVIVYQTQVDVLQGMPPLPYRDHARSGRDQRDEELKFQLPLLTREKKASSTLPHLLLRPPSS